MFEGLVVVSHIQRIVLATEETTVTQQVSHRPTKCQSRSWSKKGPKVNGSHHGDSPLVLQALALTNNVETVNQISSFHIESNLDRLELLSPTHDQRSQQSRQITLQSVLINKPEFLKVIHHTEIY